MHADRSNAIDFWPGYVDALINVVLNLLFVVSLFCGGLLATGLQVSSPSPTREHRPAPPGSSAPPSVPDAPATATAPPTPMSIRSPATASASRAPVTSSPDNTAASAPESGLPVLADLTLHVRASSRIPSDAPSVKIRELALPEGGMRLDVGYPAGTSALDDAAAALLARWVTQERRGRAIQITASTDLEQAAARQATYRRLIAVRDILIAAGQPGAGIEIRLLAGGQWPERGGGTVWVREMSATNEVPDTPAP